MSGPPSGGRLLHDGSYWQLTEHTGLSILWLVRTAKPFPTVGETVDAARAVFIQIRPHHRTFGVLIDVRASIVPNNPAVQPALREMRRKMATEVARIVLLCGSVEASMMLREIVLADKIAAVVSHDPQDALRRAMGGLGAGAAGCAAVSGRLGDQRSRRGSAFTSWISVHLVGQRSRSGALPQAPAGSRPAATREAAPPLWTLRAGSWGEAYQPPPREPPDPATPPPKRGTPALRQASGLVAEREAPCVQNGVLAAALLGRESI